MPIRLARLVLLPMLAFLLAIPSLAHAGAFNEDIANCKDDSNSPPPPLFAPGPEDHSTATAFSATRTFPASATTQHPEAHLAVCRASLTLVPSHDSGAHLAVTLPKPLPSGHPAATVVRRFEVTSSGIELDIDAPTGVSPHVELALPVGTPLDLGIVQGNLEVTRLLGDARIAIVKGNATLHLADSDFATLECATLIGGIRDHRPNGIGSRGHVLSTWTGQGTGSARVKVSAVSGDLILQPPVS